MDKYKNRPVQNMHIVFRALVPFSKGGERLIGIFKITMVKISPDASFLRRTFRSKALKNIDKQLCVDNHKKYD